ncbi:hypothetical protein H0H87_012331, partial [Tephrocybe sp. NHM501043]
ILIKSRIASGDIRNLVRTVNSLPADFKGQCDILFNDYNPLVVGHNIVVLWALLGQDIAPDDAAELALHFMYSSMLTPAMSKCLLKSLDMLNSITHGSANSVAIDGRGTLNVFLASNALDETKKMLRTKYGQSVASRAYTNVMCSSERQDYTDRFINSLDPGHRLAFSHFKKSGILAPFSLDVSHFNEPNR